MPISEFTRYRIRNAVVAGAKVPAPTIAMLFPAAYMALTKSVGVLPLIAVTDVPNCGWMRSPIPTVRVNAQTTTTVTRIAGPQTDSIWALRWGLNGRAIARKKRQTQRATW